MNDSLTSSGSQVPPAHPLARELVAALTASVRPRVLLLGLGSGRNLHPFAAANASVDVVEEDAERARDAAVRFSARAGVRVARAPYAGPYPFAGGFDGALSTHALLHGTSAAVASAVASVARRLAPGAPFFATLGSARDPRFAAGEPTGTFASAPRDGSERGVPHVYYDEARARAAFAEFEILSLVETPAAETVGRWAHDATEAETIVHWFVRARKRGR